MPVAEAPAAVAAPPRVVAEPPASLPVTNPEAQPARTVERPRRISRAVFVGDVQVGGGAPISVQSMTTG
ncbi:MAG: hypothetical protein AAGF99_10650, partial [Bacteroidota bacterium]